jgi:hypothetical protein
MPSNQPTNRIRNEVADIADQLAQLYEHRERLLQADSMGAVDQALEDIEHSMDVLEVCVAALKSRIGLQREPPEGGSDEALTRPFF